MTVVVDDDQREKVIIFGGITDHSDKGVEKNGLGNQVYVAEFVQVI